MNKASPCGAVAGRTSFWINWKGEMTPCGMMVTPAAYPFRDGLMPAWMELREKTEKNITSRRVPAVQDERPVPGLCCFSVYRNRRV